MTVFAGGVTGKMYAAAVGVNSTTATASAATASNDMRLNRLIDASSICGRSRLVGGCLGDGNANFSTLVDFYNFVKMLK
jgi:hypothetical protein